MNYYRPVVRLAFMGYGHVARETIKLLHEKAASLPFSPAIAGIYTRKLGYRWVPGKAFFPHEILQELPPARRVQGGPHKFIERIQADVVIELTHPNIDDRGEPAAGYIRTALETGKHVVTANKGPIAFHYAELLSLARKHRRLLRFESTVADGLPIFNLVRYSLPLTRIRRVRGLLNSTANYVLSRMAAGVPQMRAVAEARAAGIAEADFQLDLDGWDSAIKCMVLANALWQPIELENITRDAFDQRAQEIIARAAASGGKPQQVVTLTRSENGDVHAAVRLQVTPPDDPFYSLSGYDLGLMLETDTMGNLFLVEQSPGLRQTAFGVLADLVDIYLRGIAPEREPTLFDADPEQPATLTDDA